MTVALVLLLFAAPAAAFWTLTRGLDPFGRLVVAVPASIVTVAGTAQIMLVAGTWSPGGGLAAVLVLSALVAVLGRPRGRPGPPPSVPDPRPPRPPAAVTREDLPARRRDEDDEWIFQE
ncbi:hypothetical protein [Spirillospora sp. CA-294931]|uniref:hypothetical protein n=1 Tax=Spirillospora sp. CA-294931 TaxID=3240042 RepID=UPI003D8B2DBC